LRTWPNASSPIWVFYVERNHDGAEHKRDRTQQMDKILDRKWSRVWHA